MTTEQLLAQQNAELEKALAIKNHELEIEAALDKVRSVAMSMKHPADMLEICKTIAQQLALLNVKEIRNVQSAIFYEDKGTYMNYEYYAKHDKTFITETSYTNHEIHRSFASQMLKGSGEFYITHIKADAVKDWIAYQKTTNVFIDNFLETANSLTYHWFSLGAVALGISTYEPLNEEDINLFKRFLKVFELSYTRYLDIEKAETQAREAQIEAALERVRARSLAMHNTSELQDVIHTLHKELLKLNIAIHGGSFIAINSDIETALRCWGSGGTADTSEEVHLPYYDKPFCTYLINKIKSGPGFFTEEYTQEEKKDFFTFLFKHEPWSKLDPKQKEETLSGPGGYTRSCCVCEHTCIFIINHFGEKFSAADNDILKRFAKVFEQTYTRFLDLQKAEAQARESQIQLALERVRARTMAMQHSNELADASFVLDSQVRALGIQTRGCAFNIYGDNESTEWFSSAMGTMPTYITPRENVFLRYYEAGKNGAGIYVEEFAGEKCRQHYEYLCTLPVMGDALRKMIEAGGSFPARQIDHVVYFKYGYLLFITLEPVPEAKEVFIRFAKVFEQTYTRFLDLQKAEAQAREAQIQLGLERVQAKAMSMHYSDELKDLVKILFVELSHLDVKLGASLISLYDESENSRSWFFSQATNEPAVLFIPYTTQPFYQEMLRAWKERAHDWNYCLEGQAKIDWEDYLFTKTDFALMPSAVEEDMRKPDKVFFSASFYNYGSIQIAGRQPFSDESIDIIRRFGKVFELSYTRFLDLKKAEAQARESQIQLALERVRARTMAMQKSDELIDAATLMFQQVETLGAVSWNCGFNIWDEDKKFATSWNGSKNGIGQPFKTPSSEDVYLRFYEASKQGEALYVEEIGGEKLQAHYKYLSTLPGISEILKGFMQSGISLPAFQVFHIAYFAQGYLMFITYKPVPELWDIFKRFAKVFEQTYTRFLDLQKAEAQTREAQIEAALEKVRAVAMSMMKSPELLSVCEAIYKQLIHLGFVALRSAQIYILNDQKQNLLNYDFSDEFGGRIGEIKYSAHAQVLLFVKNVKASGDKLVRSVLAGDELNEWRNFLHNTLGQQREQSLEQANELYYYHCSIENGSLSISAFEKISEEQGRILERLRNVFSLSYKRYVDIALAEAQAREAQIEAALEKVRSQSLAMHKTEELKEVIAVVFEKLKDLGLSFNDVGIQLFDRNTKDIVTWVAAPDHLSAPALANIPYSEKEFEEDIIFRDCRIAKETRKEIFNKSYSKEEKDRYFDYIGKHNTLENLPAHVRQHQLQSQYYTVSFVPETNSALWIDSWSQQTISEEELNVLKRFAKVFEQSYIRFLDLQKAEAQAKEAQVETALERVRSRTLAMQKSEELAETSAVLFKQLIQLGISPNRLYISIIKDENGETEFWITDEDGSKVSKAYEDNLNNNLSFKKMYEGWQQQRKSLVIDMQGEELKEYLTYLSSIHVPFKGGLTQTRRLQYIAYFSKGFIGMASPGEQPRETLQLLERFAYVFNLTFTRFTDLKMAEAHALQAEQDLIAIKAARKKAEDALTELKATQKQLIQSEKMASLGELTAGIAHEIQNPLNFVNNFSEVSNELVDEMKAELATGNLQLVTEIANDIKQNLEKISHHGKRADAIVKGMLEHSRTSTGIKEPTDINKLADEYLRLAYHGMRARDKNFNAEIKTDFDETIGKINIIPQDIGRVLLNLFNNAFYAVKPPNPLKGEQWKPVISVTTRKITPLQGMAAKVEITVSDNGDGIPASIKDKIFQPFFTTKPTGQGTGLGLSLAYDIVKAHGGEIKAESKEGEGTSFIIQLPVA